MSSMVFRTKLVIRKKNPWTWVTNSGVILLVCSVLLGAKEESLFTVWEMLLGFAVMITGAILTRKNPLLIALSNTELAMTSEGVKVGDLFFPMRQLQYLDFLVNGHYGMRAGAIVSRWTMRRARIDGTENQLFFEFEGKKHSYRFFLEDDVSMRELEHLFREFYKDKVFFRERNRGGRTFLFQQVMGRSELEAAKRDAGYA